MSETKTNIQTGIATEIALRDEARRKELEKANVLYWRAVKTAADGGKVTAQQSTAIADAMVLLDLSQMDFDLAVSKLHDLRRLRDEGDRERAAELQVTLREAADAIWEELQEAKRQTIVLEQKFNVAAAEAFGVVDRANAAAAEAKQLAEALLRDGAVLDELAEPQSTRMARVRALRQCFVGESLREEDDVFEMAVVRSGDVANANVEFVAWVDPEPEEATE